MKAVPFGPDTRLRLADHVRACRLGDRIVLLDLLHGRYIGVGGQPAHRLANAIDGWPSGDVASAPPSPTTDLTTLVQPLLAQGLLSRHAPGIPPAGDCRIEIAAPCRSLELHEAMTTTSTNLRDLRRFLQAAAVASLWLRWRSMHTIVKAVKARRLRCNPNQQGPDLQRLRATMATYEKLRPLVFTARDRCLFDSLALMNFLAGEGLFPRWVVGVKASPFRAHSWVQCGDIVLNDLHENVRRFQPILVV